MTALSVPGFQRPDDRLGSTLVHSYRQQLSVSKDSPEAGALLAQPSTSVTSSASGKVLLSWVMV